MRCLRTPAMKTTLLLLLLSILMPLRAAERTPDEPPAAIGPIAFHIFRLADYKALIANRTLEEMMKDENATRIALASGTCRPPSEVRVRSATLEFSFNIHMKHALTEQRDFAVSYSIHITSEKGNPILDFDTSDAIIHPSPYRASVAFSDASVKDEFQVATVFQRIKPTL